VKTGGERLLAVRGSQAKNHDPVLRPWTINLRLCFHFREEKLFLPDFPHLWQIGPLIEIHELHQNMYNCVTFFCSTELHVRNPAISLHMPSNESLCFFFKKRLEVLS